VAERIRPLCAKDGHERRLTRVPEVMSAGVQRLGWSPWGYRDWKFASKVRTLDVVVRFPGGAENLISPPARKTGLLKTSALTLHSWWRFDDRPCPFV